MALLKCENLRFSYEGHIVFEDLSFNVQSGDYLLIVGENGSGKSTLVKGILGLKQPDSGKIIFGDGLMKNQIGYLPQQADIQKDFPASVLEVVLSGQLNQKGLLPFYNKKDKEHAIGNLKKLGIEDLKGNSFQELSGGQRQRVLLARALCSARKLILFDEPASDLDPLATNQLYRLIDDLNKNHDLSVIMVSHDVHGGTKSANKILHIEKCNSFFGNTNDYMNTEKGKSFSWGADND